MPPFARPLLNHLRHPVTLSIFGFSFFPSSRSLTTSIPSSSASCTRYLIRQPSPAALRECPTPVILVRALGLSPGLGSSSNSSSEPSSSEEKWTDWSGMFAEKGYTAVEIDITAPTTQTQTQGSTQSPFPSMTSSLSSQIRLFAIPFPPILVASGLSCLLTQSYIGDNPASGLVMINPPPDSDPRNREEGEGEKEWEWPVFNYEPRFPIMVVAHEGEMSALQAGSRVMQAAEGSKGRGGKGVTLQLVRDDDIRGEGTRVAVERWMDMSGF